MKKSCTQGHTAAATRLVLMVHDVFITDRTKRFTALLIFSIFIILTSIFCETFTFSKLDNASMKTNKIKTTNTVIEAASGMGPDRAFNTRYNFKELNRSNI